MKTAARKSKSRKKRLVRQMAQARREGRRERAGDQEREIRSADLREVVAGFRVPAMLVGLGLLAMALVIVVEALVGLGVGVVRDGGGAVGAREVTLGMVGVVAVVMGMAGGMRLVCSLLSGTGTGTGTGTE